jgi:nicotinamide N-methyltransferase
MSLFDNFVTLQSSQRDVMIVYLPDLFTESQTLFTWPCAYVLSAYLYSREQNFFVGKRIIEIGAGTAMPSLVAAMRGSSKCIITDRMDNLELLEHLKRIIQFNALDRICQVVRMSYC